MNRFCTECGSQRAGARKVPADAAQEKQEGKQGQWQYESLSKSFWNRLKEVRIQIAVPRQSAMLTSQ